MDCPELINAKQKISLNICRYFPGIGILSFKQFKYPLFCGK